MVQYTFNTTTLDYGPHVGNVPIDQLPSTPTLRRAPLHKAVLFGGPLVSAVLESCPLVGDRKYVLVDTKVSHLLPGFYPSIPGWHTDGVPRHRDTALGPEEMENPPLRPWEYFGPFNYGPPSQAEQQRQHDEGYYPRFHSVHVGLDSPTEFLLGEFHLDLELGETEQLYKEMHEQVERWTTEGHESGSFIYDVDFGFAKPGHGQWVTWDWWQIHRAIKAEDRGFRLWIRVTECNDPPRERDFILRPQNQIYVDGQDQAW